MAAAAIDHDEGMITGINVTPLVDIILVLLIVFMVTANLINSPSIAVDLPKAATGEGSEPTTLGLTLTKEGELYLNGEPTDEAHLRAQLPALVAGDGEIQAIIAADRDVSHGAVVNLIDLVRQMGIYRFALNIDAAPASEASLR